MKRERITLLALCAIGIASTARADDRSGVRPEVLSVPSGPGSIEGLGDAFSPSQHTGTGNFSIPIRVPPAVAGFVASVALHYSSGSGNGEIGLGWSLGMPLLQRSTDRRLPRYDGNDVLAIRGMSSGATEELAQLPDG